VCFILESDHFSYQKAVGLVIFANYNVYRISINQKVKMWFLTTRLIFPAAVTYNEVNCQNVQNLNLANSIIHLIIFICPTYKHWMNLWWSINHLSVFMVHKTRCCRRKHGQWLYFFYQYPHDKLSTSFPTNKENQSAEGTEFVRHCCCIILDATQFSKLCYSFLYRKFEMNTTHSNL